MDPERARRLLQAERDEVQQLLSEATSAGRQDWVAERETGDSADPAQPLTDEGVNNAVAETLRDRLAAITRAEQRLSNGTFGQSIRSGLPIPDASVESNEPLACRRGYIRQQNVQTGRCPRLDR